MAHPGMTPAGGHEPRWITILAANYLAFARVLAESLERVHGRRLTAVISDRRERPPGEEPFDVVIPADLGMPADWAFRYTRKERASALKPLALRHVLDEGAAAAIFVDPDMVVLERLDQIEALARDATVAVSPHLLEPVPGPHGRRIEREVLRAGVFNGGLVSVSDGDEGRAFLDWWQARIDECCRHDTARGIHYDQRWLDFVPSLFPGWRRIADPGSNVGWWRLLGRHVDIRDDGVLVDGHACRLMHFSGFRPGHPIPPSAYYPDLFPAAGMEGAEPLFARYGEDLMSAGYADTIDLPDEHGTYDDGLPVPDIARVVFDGLGDGRARFGDPFSARAEGSFRAWLDEPVDGESPAVTRLWMEVHSRRPDLTARFPDPLGADRAGFVAWAGTDGYRTLVRPYVLDTPAMRQAVVPGPRYEARPEVVPAREECSFYHSIDIPGQEPARGQWEISDVDAYLGRTDMKGLRVLDVGTATGFLAFAAEDAGAREVVALDIALDDVPPPPRFITSSEVLARRMGLRAATRRGFWHCHRARGSRVRLLLDDITAPRAIPDDFDVAILGNVLQHVADPEAALVHLARVAHTLIVTEAHWGPESTYDDDRPRAFEEPHLYSWFQVGPRFVERVLAEQGLSTTTTWHHQHHLGSPVFRADRHGASEGRRDAIAHFTVVARRHPGDRGAGRL